MTVSRLAAPGWTLLCSLGLVTACAADAGDASKALATGVIADGDGGGIVGNDGSESTGVDSAGGGADGAGGGGFDAGSSDSTTVSSNDGGSLETSVADVGASPDTSAPPEASVDTGPAPPIDAGPDCLKNIPASCPNCMTMNASDMPACEKYIACYLTNSCNPTDACGGTDGVCGVNMVGGGSAPQTAAEATYACACP
jgi:hypothetical protein